MKLTIWYRRTHCDEPRRPYKLEFGFFHDRWHFWAPLGWTRRFYKHEQDWGPS